MSNLNNMKIDATSEDYDIAARVDVLEHGCDSEDLYFVSEKWLQSEISRGTFDDTIMVHYYNAQEEMRCMLAEG